MPLEEFDATPRPRLQIGEWRADATTNELSRAGQTVRIEPKAMEVLMLLADRAGRVVSREALFSAVWPGVVVGDEALTQCIIKLRKAFGDNPRSPAYIDTISKRGYRLIAAVSQAESAPATLAGTARQAVPPVRPARTRRRFGSSALIAALLLVAFGAIAWYAFHPLAPAPSAETIDAADESQSPSLTVTIVPFESLGADAEQAYLARGISNDLLTELSRLPGLRLISASGAVGNATSIPLLRTAMRFNPDGGYLYYLILGRAYLFENDVEQALINLREAAARNPVSLETRVYLAAANVAAGDRSAAQWEAEEIRALEPGFALQGWLDTHPLTSARHIQTLVELLAKAGL